MKKDTNLIFNPVLLRPSFIRYLTADELKVVVAIQSYNGNKNEETINEIIAFFGGFKNSEIVENIKQSLEKKELLNKDMTLNIDDWERKVLEEDYIL